ncbi:MAG: ABC transporter ATP-binding protein [Chloroflexi bacterium]|jgi:ATP-binding cassette subfamily B protein/subfamily B ATP-binding cassette protein MsbA|nr:ABC transporter ATP-binding protein [Anaerolineaceae bacterium]NLI43989.1 ABC transporter ATP-binding protein [Chloroflexota bacterium]HOE34289.1 ABC transporter ATP-binding protein [Anaerolineaceae bacterium]HOT25871.1 ABC transporter ATP-binding protein [Anaerolineaceae bacterium]HQH58020.1 ABC transporter ATP-binding protein [Anaerolineaceae bacterium]
MRPLSLLLKLSKRYLRSIALTTLTMLGLVAAQLLIPWLIRTLISTLTASSLAQTTLDTITRLTAAALLVFIARGFMQFVRSFQAHIAGWGVVADSRKLVYQQLQRLSLRYYEDKQTGQLMSRVINDTELFERMIAHALPDVFVNAVTLIGVTAILFSVSWQLTLLTLIPIPIIALTLMLYARLVRPAFRYRQSELGELNAVLNDSITGVREIKAFAHEDIAMVKVGARIENYLRSNLKALKIMAIFTPILDFAAGIGQLIVIYFGSRLALKGSLQIADLVAFFLYLDSFYQPVRNLNNAWEAVQESLAGFERVAEILNETPDITEPEKPVPLPKPVRGALRFENVSFHYIPQETILNNISLDIPAGSTLALVGPTGVGKSTLASLIPRFYDVCGGRITLDGIDIRCLDTKELRGQISMVLQDVVLFHGSIRENILFGNPQASEEEMLAAAKIANVHEFIPSMPNGYDTMIGERGVKLSGGQKQRISIARALLKNSPILILDEATSSVDAETEMLIQEALERLIEGRTTIIIAHRLSTVRNADQIAVLEGSTITEIGTHADLIAREGHYHRLYSIQQRLN